LRRHFSAEKQSDAVRHGQPSVWVEEGIIGARMRLGDLLVGAGLLRTADVVAGLERQAQTGTRLGDNLVALGLIEQQVLNAFLKKIPAEPASIESTGIDPLELLALLMKLIYTGHLETARQFVETIKLPYHVVAELVQMAVDRALLRTLGTRLAESPLDMGYTFTEEGKRWTIDALERMQYAGPAPVTLKDFSYQVNLQKLTNELVTFERIRKSLGELTVEDSFVEQSGPALNSGRAMLLYGPPGNGKTSVAFCLSRVFTDVIYIPYAISVEGQRSCRGEPIGAGRREPFIYPGGGVRRALGGLPQAVCGDRRRADVGDA